MIRIDLHLALHYEVDPGGADFIFNIHPAYTACQQVSNENLWLSQPVVSKLHTDPTTGNRYLRLTALPGELKLTYSATVDLLHHRVKTADLFEVPVHDLPPQALGYIYPSRYCQSDRLIKLATRAFGGMWQGYDRVQAIAQWVQDHVAFTSNSSNANTSAVDTLIEQVGICRDFAHLMIALCRAVNIPARFATGTDYGADPVLGPPDFHAYVEVYLQDPHGVGRWYIFDASGTAIPMAFMRFGTGRDAADVAFATIFGGVQTHAPFVKAWAVDDASRGMELPYRCVDALSTD